jgi:hypothetical protein
MPLQYSQHQPPQQDLCQHLQQDFKTQRQEPRHDIVTKSFLGTSAFHHFIQQHPPTLPSCLLLPHVAACAARHSDPSSIYDGALAMLVKPSFTLWKIMLHTYAFLHEEMESN